MPAISRGSPFGPAPLPAAARGSHGDVTLRGVDCAADVTYRNLPDASYIAVRASHVRVTGTTAGALVGEA